ncbi:hypothetical protein ACFE04_031985 [Oxalis oulophora]
MDSRSTVEGMKYGGWLRAGDGSHAFKSKQTYDFKPVPATGKGKELTIFSKLNRDNSQVQYSDGDGSNQVLGQSDNGKSSLQDNQILGDSFSNEKIILDTLDDNCDGGPRRDKSTVVGSKRLLSPDGLEIADSGDDGKKLRGPESPLRNAGPLVLSHSDGIDPIATRTRTRNLKSAARRKGISSVDGQFSSMFLAASINLLRSIFFPFSLTRRKMQA